MIDSQDTRGEDFPGNSENALSISVTELSHLRLSELRQKWRQLFARPLPRCCQRQQLVRHIVWQLQQDKFGGLTTEHRRRIREIPNRLKRREFAKADHALGLRPGTIISRVWRQRRHEVIVCEGGFKYRGEDFATLSAVAERVTGQHRSGNAFFGLNDANLWAASNEQD